MNQFNYEKNMMNKSQMTATIENEDGYNKKANTSNN